MVIRTCNIRFFGISDSIFKKTRKYIAAPFLVRHMKANARLRAGLVLIIILLVFIPAVTAQAGQTTFLTVQTSDTILGRVVSITATDAGSYSVTITRNMNVIPAKIGDTLLDGDIVTLVPGAFANIQLVDQPDVTMLGGGTSGLAARISRVGGASVTSKATIAATGSDKPVIKTCMKTGEVGRITYIQGRYYIHRNARIIPATVSESLMADDLIYGDDPDGEIIIQLDYSDHPDAGGYTLTGRTRYSLTPYCPEPVRSEGMMGEVEGVIETVSTTIDDLWSKLKEILRGESFGVKTPTATAGVRG
ncbi:MAG: hypothetical protein M0R30_00510 [Methanoregula sp.]|jgi:hypothetical protein|uniref:hypothetical protein n=1 Tax=Methanoregula sp. TaxID=2052170 RepID=UPI0025FF8F58|nr:hypothetical protein [Methanoregula sp.]MCK9630100.1 hypothetical protein [Methanoregula sp.]